MREMNAVRSYSVCNLRGRSILVALCVIILAMSCADRNRNLERLDKSTIDFKSNGSIACWSRLVENELTIQDASKLLPNPISVHTVRTSQDGVVYKEGQLNVYAEVSCNEHERFPGNKVLYSITFDANGRSVAVIPTPETTSGPDHVVITHPVNGTRLSYGLRWLDVRVGIYPSRSALYFFKLIEKSANTETTESILVSRIPVSTFKLSGTGDYCVECAVVDYSDSILPSEQDRARLVEMAIWSASRFSLE